MEEQRATPAVGGVHPGSHPDPKQRDDAAAKMDSVPVKSINDLPEDHPMRRREEMLQFIEDQNAAADGRKGEPATEAATDPDVDAEDAEAEAARKQLAEDAKQADKKPATKAAEQVQEQLAEDAPVLDADTILKSMVRVKIDGVEELVPASKVLGQYQKGGAADVKLANAGKTLAEARAAADKILSEARAAATSATAPTQVAAAQTQVANTEAALKKFKEAADSMYSGDADQTARLFMEAQSLAQAPAPAPAQAVQPEDLVQQVTQSVKQQLSVEGALNKLFTDYPEIKAKKAFALMADEYIEAYVAAGETREAAIAHAGDTLGEEYGLGKAKAKPTGRPIVSGGPTTNADKLKAKDALDSVEIGNARAVSAQPEAAETPQSVIAAMAASRAGSRV